MLLPPMTLASAQSPAPPPGTYAYTATVAGKRVGTATITVTDNGVIEIAERAVGSLNGQPGSAQAVLTLGSDLAPTAYTGNYEIAGAQQHTDVTLTPTTATIGSQAIALTPGATHFVVVEPGLMAGIFALPAEMHAWNDAPALAVMPSLAQGFPIVPSASTGPRPAGVATSDVALGFGGQFPFTIWYDPNTFVTDEVDVPGQNLVVSRTQP